MVVSGGGGVHKSPPLNYQHIRDLMPLLKEGMDHLFRYFCDFTA